MASGVGLMHQRQHARRRGVSQQAKSQLYSREVGVGCLKFVRQEGEVTEGGKYELCVVCRCVLRIEGRSWLAGSKPPPTLPSPHTLGTRKHLCLHTWRLERNVTCVPPCTYMYIYLRTTV